MCPSILFTPRQVTKKHDKYCGGSAGSRFLQACWDAGHLQWGGFLHSPLMVRAQMRRAWDPFLAASPPVLARDCSLAAIRCPGCAECSPG